MRVDHYLPEFDVRDYHARSVAADAESAFSALRNLDIRRSRVVRTLFAVRTLPERFRRGASPAPPAPRSFLEDVLRVGWRILEEAPGRELVLGAVTRPWAAVVTFRGLSPSEFAAFAEPGFTKIVWNLAVAPEGPGHSRVSIETRVLATDPASRRRFRRYWILVGLGIRWIRRASLKLLERELVRGGTTRSGSSAARRTA